MPTVGNTIPHDSAISHVTGRADYIEDLPRWENELVVGVVGSSLASGKIISIDIAKAKNTPGVVAVLTYADIPGHQVIGPFFRDEEVLASQTVTYVGQPIVVVAATTKEALRAGQSAVQITIEPIKPILSILEAIRLRRFIGPQRRIAQGDAGGVLPTCAHQLHGVLESGGQEQFYLESQAALAVPGEENQITIHSSTQNTTEIQHVVAEVLGIGNHQVVATCKRMGGAFGGKETQAALPAIFAALVSHHTRRPARILYSKDEDMQITGKRHDYYSKWSVGFDGSGRIEALQLELFSNGGSSADLSTSVLERSMMHIDNAYYLPNVEIVGQVCFTNFPSNTAFRGFGGPQGVAIIENVIQEIGLHLQIDSLAVRNRNQTPYGQIFKGNHLPEILSQLTDSADYQQRRKAIAKDHGLDPRFLRGMAITPVKFGISFTTKFLNQANALVNIYTDGTVQVSTGGTEMGQGLNTKIRQIVADEFGIDYQSVIVMPTSTEKNNNTSPTAASAGTDLNGAAAVDACQIIKKRLSLFAARLFANKELGLCESPECVVLDGGFVFDNRDPNSSRKSFAELAQLARLERIDLGARGFYLTPGVDFNRETGRGNPYLYFTQGAACAEVEIDRFTGQSRVTQIDILMDIGKSINPGIDMGQIAGGFVQGMGWATAEALVYNPDGHLLSHSPTTYKIPAITDIPKHFRIRLLDNDDNVLAVRRSKAVGEPPLLLGVSVWAAMKDALLHRTSIGRANSSHCASMSQSGPFAYIETFAELARSGNAFVSVTLVDAVGSVPQEIGSKMLVDRTGLVFGTVGGGRIENQAIEQCQALLAAPVTHSNSLLVEWNLKRDIGMTCGGTVKLFFETVNHRIWSIVLFGAGHVANALVECLIKLNCCITVVDPRDEWLAKLPESKKLTKHSIAEPASFVELLPDRSFVLLMTMGHRTDRPILEAILKSGRVFPYLGVIGSKGKRGALRKELLAAGLSEELVDSFRCPIGLPLGSNEPAEIAISVTAELLQVRDQNRNSKI
jgi:xanthine dehydrogenase large subunit